MVFQSEAQFRQLCHCNFRENVVKLLYIPVLSTGVGGADAQTEPPVFLIVNKYGKVGLYNPDTFALVHTYVLDLSVPMQLGMDKALRHMAKYNKISEPPAKCQQTHLVVDAVYCPDFRACLFLTSKRILQCYDIGEIETQTIGLELLPRKKFMGLKYGRPVMPIRNRGHVETHRLYGLREFPTCMTYSPGTRAHAYTEEEQRQRQQDLQQAKVKGRNSEAEASDTSSRDTTAGAHLLIGDSEGCVTFILLDAEFTGRLFGLRKIRGTRHELNAFDLFNRNVLKVYKAHNGPVKQLLLLRPRQLVISCCATDRRYSLFVNDLMVSRTKPYIVSCPKGINTFTHSSVLKMMATGSNDCLIRLFNDFVTQMPQMELVGHKSPVLAVEFVHVSFCKTQILFSYSKDVELRAWDPVNFVCLQSIYVSFRPKSALICKTPEFAQNCLYVHQPHYTHIQDSMKFGFTSPEGEAEGNNEPVVPESKSQSRSSNPFKSKLGPDLETDGDIILFYSNSYTKIYIEKDSSSWPFDFDDFLEEFEEATAQIERKLLHRQESVSRHPKSKTYFQSKVRITTPERQALAGNLDATTRDILGIKKYVDRKLGIQRSYTFDLVSDPKSRDTSDWDAGEGGAATTAEMDSLSLGTQALKRFHSLERTKKTNTDAKEDFIRQGIAFKTMPIYEIEPIKFQYLKPGQGQQFHGQSEGRGRPSVDIPITESMRAFGLTSIETVDDLITLVAKEYFSEDNMQKVRAELELTEHTLRNQIAGLNLEMGPEEALALDLEHEVPSRPPPRQSGSSSSSNATTISSFSSKLIQESNPTLAELGHQPLTTQPVLDDEDEFVPSSVISESVSSESASARCEDVDTLGEGSRNQGQDLGSDTDEFPELAFDYFDIDKDINVDS